MKMVLNGPRHRGKISTKEILAMLIRHGADPTNQRGQCGLLPILPAQMGCCILASSAMDVMDAMAMDTILMNAQV